jgi:hypothetical protein
MPDIDLDFADRKQILNLVEHISASIFDKDGNYKKHNTGVYCQSIPYNPITDSSSIDYKIAEHRGYFKIDFLNVGIYQDIKDEQHLNELLNKEPIWELLLEDDFTNDLFHVNGHGATLRTMKPKSIDELAMVLAMIRPAKKYLIGKDWDTVKKEIWLKPDTDEYYYKKSHAYAYAAAVVVHMNLICEPLLKNRL